MTLALLFTPEYVEPEWLADERDAIKKRYEAERQKSLDKVKKKRKKRKKSDERDTEIPETPLPSLKLMEWLDNEQKLAQKSLQALESNLQSLRQEEYLRREGELLARLEAIYEEMEKARQDMEDDELMLMLLLS